MSITKTLNVLKTLTSSFFLLIFIKNKLNAVDKIILILFMWSGLSMSSPNENLQDIPSDGLVAYYSFNDCQAMDQSGKQSHGKIMGSGTCRCGVEGNGIMLNGRTDYIEFDGQVNKYFTTSDFSLSFYFKPTSIGNSPCLGSGLRRFEGIVDELRVYEKPLSHQEIMDLYNRMRVEDAENGCVS